MGKPAILSYLETHDRLLMIMQTNCVPEEVFNMEEIQGLISIKSVGKSVGVSLTLFSVRV